MQHGGSDNKLCEPMHLQTADRYTYQSQDKRTKNSTNTGCHRAYS